MAQERRVNPGGGRSGIPRALVAGFIVYLLAVPLLSILRRQVPDIGALLRGPGAHLFRLAILFSGTMAFYRQSPRTVMGFLGMKCPLRAPVLAGSVAALPFVLAWILGSLLLDIPIALHPASASAAVIAILGPGLFEEGLFRGLVFHRVLQGRSWYGAALITGLFFGPAHLANLLVGHTLPEIAISVIAGFVMSFPLGYLFFRSGNVLWGCVAFHVLIAGSMDVLITEEAIRANLGSITLATSVGLLLSLVAVFAVLWAPPFRRRLRPSGGEGGSR